MRALVTGASGFVGPYLVERLRDERYDVTSACGAHESKAECLPIDVLDAHSLAAALDIADPDVVFHLAAQSFVPRSLEAPQETYEINTLGTAHLLAALRERRAHGARNVRLVFASSAQVYGAALATGAVTEQTPLDPVNPYGASKAAAEMLILADVHSFGLDAVIARAFNHIGPGQHERFVVPSLVRQLRAIAAGEQRVLCVGNLDVKRDFLDVRDVVNAYVALAQRGQSAQAYNVCSGRATSIRDILGELVRIAHVPVEIREDPQKMRSADVALSYGSNAKLRAATAWEPRVSLRRSLQDIYQVVEMSAHERPAQR